MGGRIAVGLLFALIYGIPLVCAFYLSKRLPLSADTKIVVGVTVGATFLLLAKLDAIHKAVRDR